MDRLGEFLDLSNPLVQTVVMPLSLGLVLAGVIRLIGGPGRGQGLASLAVCMAFVASYAVTLGVPPWPPRGAIQKIAYIAAIGAAIGLVLDLVPRLRGQIGLVVLVGTAAALAWLGWNRMGDFGPNRETAQAIAAALAGMAVLWRLGAKIGEAQTGGILALVVAFGSGAIALIGNSASLAQLCFAVAASIGGFMLWNWPVARFPFGAAGVFGAAGAVVAMTMQMSMFTRASVPALVLLALAAFADIAARPLQPTRGAFAKAVQPIVVGLAAGIVAGAAIGLAYFLDDQP